MDVYSKDVDGVNDDHHDGDVGGDDVGGGRQRR